jgi:hypothetical protein
LRFGHSNAHLLIGLNHLHFITDSLDHALMKSRRDTFIGVYPIPFEQHIVTSLHVHYEEGRRHSFAPNRYLFVDYSFCLHRIPCKTAKAKICTFKITFDMVKLLEQ